MMKTYKVGYGKTDPKTLWKKGQCGNPRKRRPCRIPSVAGMIDDAFVKKVSVRENGVARPATAFEVILRQLLLKMAQGNTRAIKIHRKYQAYAQAHPTLVYEPPIDPEKAAAEFKRLLESDWLRPRTKEEKEYDEAWERLTLLEKAAAFRDLLDS